MASGALVDEIKNQVAEKGLPPLIEREFVQISSDKGEVIRIMQWNVLAQGLSGGDDNFIHCPKEALDWNVRKIRIIEEIARFRPTVLCCEEVDMFDYLLENLSKLGYLGIFSPKPKSPCMYNPDNMGPDGCALFYNSHKVALSESSSVILEEADGKKSNQVSIIGRFMTKSNAQKEFNVAVTHLKAKKGFEENRAAQIASLTKIIGDKFPDAPVLICGDFNASPSEKVYDIMKSCSLDVGSCYSHLSGSGSEPKFTTWKTRPGGEVCHTIDYIWYSKKSLKVKSVLNIPSEAEVGEKRLPSLKYPSDHVSLVCDLILM